MDGPSPSGLVGVLPLVAPENPVTVGLVVVFALPYVLLLTAGGWATVRRARRVRQIRSRAQRRHGLPTNSYPKGGSK